MDPLNTPSTLVAQEKSAMETENKIRHSRGLNQRAGHEVHPVSNALNEVVGYKPKVIMLFGEGHRLS